MFFPRQGSDDLPASLTYAAWRVWHDVDSQETLNRHKPSRTTSAKLPSNSSVAIRQSWIPRTPLLGASMQDGSECLFVRNCALIFASFVSAISVLTGCGNLNITDPALYAAISSPSNTIRVNQQ